MQIGILDDYQMVGNALGEFDQIPGAHVTTFSDHMADEEALAKRLEPFEALVIMRERTAFPRSLLEKLPNLQILVTTGTSNDVVDDLAAKDLGIVMCGTGGQPNTTAELTFGLLLGLTKNLRAEETNVVSGGWQTLIGRALGGSTFGILGLGKNEQKVGSNVARIARALEMNVIAWTPNLTSEIATAAGAKLVSKNELFSQADFVSIHLRLTELTTGLVGTRELEMLGSEGYLINTSRGQIVDEKSLIRALENGTIAGAGLDVFDVEPLPLDHPFRSAPRLLLTPHIGYTTIEGYRIMYRDARENIEAYLAGNPIRIIDA